MRSLTALALLCALAATFPAGPLHAASPSSDNAKAQAKAHFGAGRAAYRTGDFAAALTEFVAAYKLLEEPAFLYNIAQCRRQLGQDALALAAFRSYLATTGEDDATRAEVIGVIAELEREIAQRVQSTQRSRELREARELELARAEASRSEAQRLAAEGLLHPASSAHARALWAPGAAIGLLGLVALGGGTGAALVSSAAADRLATDSAVGAVFDQQTGQRYERGRVAAIALFSIGSALTLTGAGLLAAGLGERRRALRRRSP